VSICRSVCAVGMSGFIVGSGWFSSCSKCSFHLLVCIFQKQSVQHSTDNKVNSN